MSVSRSSLLWPFAAACLGIALFSLMDALMKELSVAIGSYNASFWRSVVGVMLGSVWFLRREPWPRREVMRIHALRGLEVAAMVLLYFWGLTKVPLAEGIALTFIAPLIALYLAAVLLKEHINARAIVASVIGFAGVLVIAYGRASAQSTPDAKWGIAAILVAAVFYAHNLILQRQQAQVAKPLEVAFFNTLFVLLFLLSGAPWMLHLPPVAQIPLIFGSAVIAFISVMLLSWAYARAEAKVLVPVEYTAFIWGALLGFTMFHESLTPTTLIGTVLIVAGCVAAALQEQTPHQPSAELGL